ncbi:tetratricopeptide repeat protein [Dissulfuribacter thermophilus]|nr:tetratricopeptide repeat protein [Dissulfuribacter thermophilus]
MKCLNIIVPCFLLLWIIVFHFESSCSANDTFDVKQWIAELENRTNSKGFKDKKYEPQAKKERSKFNAEQTVQRISVDFYKMDLHNVFRLLGEISGKNIVVDESVSGTITLALKDVPWPFVLDVIKSLKGLSSIERFNTIMIFPAGKEITWVGDNGLQGSWTAGTLQVNKTSELLIPDIRQGAGLVVKKGNIPKTSISAIDEAQTLIKEGEKREQSGDIHGALLLYKKASEIWPDNALLAKKISSLALGRANEELTALNFAKLALKINPKDSEAATLAAVALARMGRGDEAINYFERAASMPDVSFESLYNYAVFTFSSGLYRETLRILNRIDAQFKVTPDCLLLRAKAYEGLNCFDKAVSEYIAILNGGNNVPSYAKEFARSRLKEIASDTDARFR